jgi:small subunit ribosomal protein S20
MPIKKAAKKAVRQAIKREILNKKVKNNLEYLIKKCRRAVETKKKKDAHNFYQTAAKALDKAVQKKIIKKNTASRLKSRLARKVNAL